jgi:hypothetical protein
MLKRNSIIFSKKLYQLTMGGAAAFWVISILTSLLPIAAEYRAAFGQRSWNAQTVWVDSLFVGMIIGYCVSYNLLRFIKMNPTKNYLQKSMLLSLIALVIAITLIDIPHSFLFLSASVAPYYFVLGVLFNAPRFLFLGLATGYLYKILYGTTRAQMVRNGLPVIPHSQEIKNEYN